MHPFGSGAPSQPGYPPQTSGFPSQPMAGGSYPAQPEYPRQGNIPQPAGHGYPGFPPQVQPGFQFQSPGYPPQAQTGYTAAHPHHNTYGAPQSTGPYPGAAANTIPYPGAQTGIPGQQQITHGAPQSTGHYLGAVTKTTPYPGAQTGMPGQQQITHGAPQSTGPYPGAVANTIPYPGAQTGMPGQQPYNYMNPSGVPPSGMVAQHNQGVSSGAPVAVRQGTPTVVAVQSDPVADAATLRKAMKGFGTDEDGLINVLCRRTNAQRLAIAQCFKTSYGKDLIDEIKSETSGNFENLLVALLTPTDVFYAKEMYKAISGLGTDEDVLIETMCTLSNQEINAVKNAFTRTYGQNLEKFLMGDTSGSFKRLMVSLCTANRDESGYVDPNRARADANALLQAGKLRVGTDESTFNMILCQRSMAHLKQVFEQYHQLAGTSLEKSIKSEFSGDIENGLLAIVQCVTNRPEFFAKCLYNSMAGLGTKDSQLIRLVVLRCEVDMQDIKVAFERKYGKTLKSFIKGDTSGHYKHALYTLIGENRS